MGKGFLQLTTYSICRHFITYFTSNQLMFLKFSENREFGKGYERNERDTFAKPLKFPFLANWLSIRTILPVLPPVTPVSRSLPSPLPSLGEVTIRAQNDLEDAVAVSEEGVGAKC